MRFRGNSTPKPSAPIRGRRWSRMALVPLVGGTFVYAVAVPPSTLHVDGLVEGDLIPVAPLYRAQVTRPLVTCYSKVKAGEPLAMMSNFLMDEQYSSDYETHKENLSVEEIAQREGVFAAIKAAQAAEQGYRAALASEQKLKQLSRAYDELYDAGAIGLMARDSARADVVRASAETRSMQEAWHKENFLLEQERKGAEAKVGSLKAQIQLVEATRKRISVQPLLSPASGQVLECAARPDAVYEAGTPIYHVFDTDRAYVKVFVDPSDMGSLNVGMPVSMHIAGIREALPGHVAAITLEATKLPESLTRYFWQHNQWAQYRPVKVSFDNLAKLKPEDKEKLFFNGKVQVKIPVASWTERLWDRS